jgi:hypothetical protein
MAFAFVVNCLLGKWEWWGEGEVRVLWGWWRRNMKWEGKIWSSYSFFSVHLLSHKKLEVILYHDMTWHDIEGTELKVHIPFFIIGIVGGGVQLGPLGTAATRRPIVPVLGDYDDGELVEWLAGETEVLRENLPQCRFVHHKPHMLSGHEPGLPRWEASD